jgi:polyketide cyclase/dehydrase/lipid transport protein
MAEENGSKAGGGAQAVLQSLKSKEVVIPAVATAASVVAYAARKGAGEAKEKLEGEAEKLGEEGAQGAKKGLGGGGALGKLASKALGGGGGGDDDGGGGGSAKKTRRLPIQRWTDVAAPIGTVYEKWTQFEEYPNFMHRVLNVQAEDENKVEWDEKIWFSSRHWEGEITERKRNKRIAWKTTSGMAHAGVVTFHKLDDELTRVMVDMDFVPQGMIEKMASGLRFVKRAVQSDLARFKAYVELGEAEGLEYQSKPAEREGEGQEDDKDEKDDESRERESAAASSS